MSELVECSSCHAAVPTGAFCSVCGHALVVVPQVVEQTVLPLEGSILPASGAAAIAAPPSGWVRRNPAVVVGVAVLVAGGAWLVQGSDHTLEGDISVLDSDYVLASDGESCSTSGGYDDVHTGGQVVVTDEDGTTLATSSLGSGTVSDGYCVFPFTVDEVGKATYYEVSTGNSNRGGPKYSASELKSQDWTVHLTLGD